MSDDREYDVIVLGAGPTGENLADRTRAAGLTTAIAEDELVGGDCSYWACVPSKALLRPPAALRGARAVRGARDRVSGDRPAAAEVLARRDAAVGGYQDGSQADWLASAGIDLYRGAARLAGPRRVAVGGHTLTARHAVAVCTGSRARLPVLPGIDEARPWTPRDATSARRVPGRLAVVGGGVAGTELAAVYTALGSRVTLLLRGERPLPRMEPFAGELVAEALAAAGAELRTGTSVTALRRPHPAGPVTLVLDGGEDGGGELEADEVLFATGRTPRTAGIGLDTVGLPDGAWLEVDDTLRVTGVDGGWLYCAGDPNHRNLLTHQGKYQARIAAAAIAARAAGAEPDATAIADTVAVPQVVFTDPEVASVGLTAGAARAAGRRVRVTDADFASVGGASLYADDYRGRARMVTDEDTGRLLGATFAGPGAGELLHAATIAVAGEVPVDRLWHAVPAFPTLSEIWLRLLEAHRDQRSADAA